MTEEGYVAYQPDLGVPGALETIEAFFGAIACGVEKLVLLSGRGGCLERL